MDEALEIARHAFSRVHYSARLDRKDPDGMITTAAFRNCIGTGRKLVIQILDFFDRTGTTMREGDLRRLREDRRFGSAGG
jgi:hypothetical protein